MKKIDKYILGKYFSSFFFCILLLTVIVVVVDISEKTDDFVQSKLSVTQIITDYYFGFIPRIDAMLFPLFVFIAVIFAGCQALILFQMGSYSCHKLRRIKS
mgnify:CR=1 FL=1